MTNFPSLCVVEGTKHMLNVMDTRLLYFGFINTLFLVPYARATLQFVCAFCKHVTKVMCL